jgi:predicted NUDIX family phosphoesterase
MPLILTLPRIHAPALPETGCWPVSDLDFLQHAQWQSRAQAEQNEAWLQPIPYLLLRNASGHIWCYQRSGGDARLTGRCSCGVGGHVDLQDAQPNAAIDPLATLRCALLREVAEELGAGSADLAQLSFQGLIFEGLSPIGRVHLGLLFTAHWLPDLPPRPVAGEALLGLGFKPASAMANNADFELWSQLAARYLS